MRTFLLHTILLAVLINAHSSWADWAMVYGTEHDIEYPWVYYWLHGDRAHDVIETADGSFLFTGQIALAREDDNRRGLWVCRVDRHGGIEWQKNFGFGIGFSLAETADGNFMVAGTNNDWGITGAWAGRLKLLKITPLTPLF